MTQGEMGQMKTNAQPTWRAKRTSKRSQPIAWVRCEEESPHGFIWPRSVFHKPYGAAMKAIRIFPRFLSFRGGGCWSVGWGRVVGWRVEGERVVGVLKGELAQVGWNHTGIYFKCIYKTKWGKNPVYSFLGHVGNTGKDNNIQGGRERGRKRRRRERQGFLLFGTLVKHTEAGRLRSYYICWPYCHGCTGQRKILINQAFSDECAWKKIQ